MFPSPGAKLDSSLVIAHMGSCAEPHLLPRFVILFGSVFALCCLLVPGCWFFPMLFLCSLYRCLYPYPVVTPVLPLSSLAYIGLTIEVSCLAYKLPLLQFLQGTEFPSCSNSLMFRPRYLLDSLIAPTAMVSC